MKIRAFFLCVILVLASITIASAAVPTIMTYQGKLSDLSGIPVKDGIYTMDFAIYNAETRGTAVWAEPKRKVDVSGGLFTVALGEEVPLSEIVFNGDRWLNTVVNDIELTPRTKLATAPYAFRAHTAEHVLSSAAVTSLNNRTGNVTLAAGDNITITPVGNTLTIASTAQDIPNPLPVIVQNQPIVGIDQNNNEVKSPTLWEKIIFWDTNQTVESGQTITTPVLNTAGYKEIRVVLAVQQQYSSMQDIEVRIYARAGTSSLALLGSANFGPEPEAFIKEGSFTKTFNRLILNIPIVSDGMRIDIRNNRATSIVVGNSWGYLVN